MYRLTREQFLPISIEEAWAFFSSAKNLARITPPDMNFLIQTDLEEKEIEEGQLIDYTIRPLFGIKMKWKTRITAVDKPRTFIDRQLKGPYAFWEHRHSFIEKDNGVLMKDEVNYQIPFGLIGNLAHSLFVRKKLNQIFDYRSATLHKIFVKNEHHSY